MKDILTAQITLALSLSTLPHAVMRNMVTNFSLHLYAAAALPVPNYLEQGANRCHKFLLQTRFHKMPEHRGARIVNKVTCPVVEDMYVSTRIMLGYYLICGLKTG